MDRRPSAGTAGDVMLDLAVRTAFCRTAISLATGLAAPGDGPLLHVLLDPEH